MQKTLGAVEETVRYGAVCVALDTLVAVKTTCTYSQLAQIVGLQPRDSKLHKYLERSMVEDFEKGEPARCSLVINKRRGLPGDGYFAQASKALNSLHKMPESSRLPFWREQVKQLIGEEAYLYLEVAARQEEVPVLIVYDREGRFETDYFAMEDESLTPLFASVFEAIEAETSLGADQLKSHALTGFALYLPDEDSTSTH